MIRVADEGGLRVVTLARTARANALDAAMLSALAEAVEGAGEAAALVLTGEGPVFSAGGDLAEVRDAGLALSPLWERLSGAVARFPGLSVAALNGTAAGGSLGMVLACDLRIAVPGAEFFYPVMRMGVLPQPSDPRRLAALVGPARAALMLVAGARVAAPEALAWGLVDRIVPDDGLMAAAGALVAPALAAGPGRVAAVKALIPRPADRA